MPYVKVLLTHLPRPDGQAAQLGYYHYKKWSSRMTTSMQAEEPIFTIGYEKSTIDDFVSRLADADIDVLVDVRELPLSRKRGFSKKDYTPPSKRRA